jgi:hypothetical protein
MIAFSIVLNNIKRKSNMKTLLSVLLLILLTIGNCMAQESIMNSSASIINLSEGLSPKERTSGFSFGAGYVVPYTSHFKNGSGIDLFLNYTGNNSQSVAFRGGIGLQFTMSGDIEDYENLEGDQILLYGKFGTLVGQVGRNNPVNYYGFGELRAGVGMVDLVSAIAADINGDEKEPYFDLGFNLGGGVSFQISGNTRFFVEPLVSFATKYNSFVIRGGFEF